MAGELDPRIPGTGELADMAQLWTLDSTPQLDPTDMLVSAQAAYSQAMDRGDVDAINTAEQRLVSIYEAHPELRTQEDPVEPRKRRGHATFLFGLGNPDNDGFIDF